MGHLGDLGHSLSEEQVDNLGLIDVLLLPVGEQVTLTVEEAVEVVSAIQPSYVVPMHYRTEKHKAEVYGNMENLDKFLKVMGAQYKNLETLVVNAGSVLDETEIVVLSPKN